MRIKNHSSTRKQQRNTVVNLIYFFFFRQDLDNATDRNLAVAVSLATVLHRTFQARSQPATSLIEKCPQFVSKEKKQKIFAKVASKKSVQKQRHNFELKQYFQIKYCNHSKELIWGVAPQGYQCTCKFSGIIYLSYFIFFMKSVVK